MLERPSEEGVHADQATQVDSVLGKRATAAGRHATEHPLRRGKAFHRVLARRLEIAEHLQEVGAFQRHRHRLDAQADPLHPFDVDAAGDLFGEHRQSFLRRGGARRGQREAGQHGLLLAVQCRQRMHEGFVLQQLVAVVVGERRARAQADPVRAGRGLGDQVGIQHHGDHPRVEIIVQRRLQLQRQRGRRDRHLFRRRQQLTIEFVGDGDEVVGGLARGRAARQAVLRLAEQRHRQIGDPRRSEVFEQLRGEPPTVRGLDQVDAERMRRVGIRRDRVELAPRVGEIVVRILVCGQPSIATRQVGQEGLLFAGRPAHQAEQADPARGLRHPRIERGVVGDGVSAAHIFRPRACTGPCSAPWHRPSAQAAWPAGWRRRRLRR